MTVYTALQRITITLCIFLLCTKAFPVLVYLVILICEVIVGFTPIFTS